MVTTAVETDCKQAGDSSDEAWFVEEGGGDECGGDVAGRGKLSVCAGAVQGLIIGVND